jgi:uncharacterized protein (DUF1501 family)
MNRRQFIERLGLLSGAGFTISGIPLRALANPFQRKQEDDNILVLIQLAGGNDGLNTLVPFEDDLYYKSRPTLALPKNQLHQVNSTLGFNPNMPGFASLFKDGKMSVIQNVGYENPDRSHFKSMDIWNSASDPEQVKENGWTARYLSSLPENTIDNREFPMAVELGWSGSLLLEENNFSHGLYMNSLEEYLAITKQYISPSNSESLSVADLEFDYINYIAVQSNNFSSRIAEVSKNGKNIGTYPTSFLAGQLSIVARLISGGLETSVYMAKLQGFDTHFLQADPHASLLKQTSEAVTAFQNDLQALGVSKKVTILIYSEFGRRLLEGSFGTDHGTAAPIFVIGDSVRGGIIGSNPELNNLDANGDLKYKYDYRQVYSTILRDHLYVSESNTVNLLGSNYPTLPIYKGSIDPYPAELFRFEHLYPNPTPGDMNITFFVTEKSYVSLTVFSSSGHEVSTHLNRNFFSGIHTVQMNCLHLNTGTYQMILNVNGKRKSKAFIKI